MAEARNLHKFFKQVKIEPDEAELMPQQVPVKTTKTAKSKKTATSTKTAKSTTKPPKAKQATSKWSSTRPVATPGVDEDTVPSAAATEFAPAIAAEAGELAGVALEMEAYDRPAKLASEIGVEPDDIQVEEMIRESTPGPTPRVKTRHEAESMLANVVKHADAQEQRQLSNVQKHTAWAAFKRTLEPPSGGIYSLIRFAVA